MEGGGLPDHSDANDFWHNRNNNERPLQVLGLDTRTELHRFFMEEFEAKF
jgi:hypothetical protein